MRASIGCDVLAFLLAGFLLLETTALAQWPPAAPQQQPHPGAQSPPLGQPQGPGPILLPMPGAPQGPSAPPALSESPTWIESEKFIVEHNPDTWAKDSVRISPDGRRAAFHAQTDGKWVVVLYSPDGTYASRLKSDIVLNETLAFTPDGKYVLSGAMANGRPHMVLNGQPAQSSYEAIWNIDGGRIVFDTPRSFSYIALKDGKIYLVREAVTLAP